MRFNSHYQGQELICHHQQPSRGNGMAVCALMDNIQIHNTHLYVDHVSIKRIH